MTRTISRLFDDRADAERAVQALEALGIPHADLSLIRNRTSGDNGLLDHDRASTNADSDTAGPNHDGDITRGASTGAVLGGVGGLLAGIGLLAIPGLGPVVAAGWLASTALGAGIGAAGGGATGTIVGLLKSEGHSEEDAHVYSEGVRRGGTLVSARVPDEMAAQAEALLDHHSGVSAEVRGRDYREGGWTGFDETAQPYANDPRMAQRDWEAGRGTRL